MNHEAFEMRPIVSAVVDFGIAVAGAAIAIGTKAYADKHGFKADHLIFYGMSAAIGVGGIVSSFRNLDLHFQQNPPSKPLLPF